MAKNKKKILWGSLLVFILLFMMSIIVYKAPAYQTLKIQNRISGYTYLIYDDHVEIDKYDNKKNRKIIHIPNAILGRPVTAINKMAFENANNIREVKISDNIEIIGEAAFSHCEMLEKVSFGKNVKEVQDVAFDRCYHLNTLVFNEGLERIGIAAFKMNSNIQSIVLPSTLNQIDRNAFESCGLQEIYFQGNIPVFQEGVFASNDSYEMYIPKEASGFENLQVDDFIQNDITLVTTMDSPAHKYAKEHSINCEIVDKIEYPIIDKEKE